MDLAEREGFEPSIQENLYAGFRIRCIRPLCHLSVTMQHAAQVKLIILHLIPSFWKMALQFLQPLQTCGRSTSTPPM